MTTPPPPQTLYFAYGSNLSPTQMRTRCPHSPLHSPPFATLHHHSWFFSTRGYANIRPRRGKSVVGLLYVLDARDEAVLDKAEGVPWAYERGGVEVEVLGEGGRRVRALVYVDPRKGEGRASREYVERLRRGREESEGLGLVVGDTWGEGWEEVDVDV